MNYGIPYQGSKNKIAKDIIDFLPSGKRLVDLFGGGMAITHCAMLTDKWNNFLYNDFNPLLKPLLIKAINGDYNYDKFKPEFITREKFFELKDTDGYVKWLWSFSNNGRDYLFGKQIEQEKQEMHNLVVFNKKSPVLEEKYGIKIELKETGIKERRLELKKIIRENKLGRCDIQQLERLEQLQQLERLERLERLELNCFDYKNYTYVDGDVVYCDIPYENTAGYGDEFNHKEFYEWVKTRTYPVYFSSYEISDNSFDVVWQKEKRSLMRGAKTKLYKIERIYTNGITGGV